ncbi:MAG: hypothetical protein II649_04860 [Kiritimatiellae bacterium]|nr:hypothetical protein [Kiritimatiellia bacterium]
MTDVERRTLACWVDLSVPFCGDYEENATWSEQERARWKRAVEKSRRMAATYK